MRWFENKSSRLKRMTKEAFDNLPSGVCYFDREGIIILCNTQMYHLASALTGVDLQSVYELRDLMNGKPKSGYRDRSVFVCEDGTAWKFCEEEVIAKDGTVYTQIIASDVTELYQKQQELKHDNEKLEKAGASLRKLSFDTATVTREEEILNLKMRVHDDIGRSVIATRQLLRQNRPASELDLSAWENAIHLLKRDSEQTAELNAFEQLKKAALGIGIHIELDGTLPDDEAASYLLLTAMRECATNAARHAGASELYVKVTEKHGQVTAVITNNGTVPDQPIIESGGLSSLRTRVEQAKGTMTISSTPVFALSVIVNCRQKESQS